MYDFIHTQDDWFPLRPEIWPWRQDYGRKTNTFASTLSRLPPLGPPTPHPEPSLNVFFQLVLYPRGWWSTTSDFSEAAATFLDQNLWRNSYTLLEDEESWGWGGVTIVPLPGHICGCANGSTRHPVSARTATLQSLQSWMLGEGCVPSTNSKPLSFSYQDIKNRDAGVWISRTHTHLRKELHIS